MKRIAICLSVLLLCLCKMVTAETIIPSGSAIINNPTSSTQNLYTQPSESADVIWHYYNGVPVSVTGSLANSWLAVTIGTDNCLVSGYIPAESISYNFSDIDRTNTLPTYQTENKNWTLHSQPADDSATVSVVYTSGTIVELWGYTDSWWHVNSSNTTGFIRNNSSALTQINGWYYDGYLTGVINNPKSSDRLNLRKRPNSKSTSLGKYYNGCPVALLAPEQNGWRYVRIGNHEGYMDARYIAVGEEINSVYSTMPTLTITNNSGKGLNLRVEPTKGAKSLGLFANGKTVQVLGVTENWYHVLVDDQVGYMLASGFDQLLSYSQGSSKKKAIVTCELIMYKYDSENSLEVITTLPTGLEITVLSSNKNGWSKVTNGIRAGYVLTKYLKFK